MLHLQQTFYAIRGKVLIVIWWEMVYTVTVSYTHLEPQGAGSKRFPGSVGLRQGNPAGLCAALCRRVQHSRM